MPDRLEFERGISPGTRRLPTDKGHHITTSKPTMLARGEGGRVVAGGSGPDDRGQIGGQVKRPLRFDISIVKDPADSYLHRFILVELGLFGVLFLFATARGALAEVHPYLHIFHDSRDYGARLGILAELGENRNRQLLLAVDAAIVVLVFPAGR